MERIEVVWQGTRTGETSLETLTIEPWGSLTGTVIRAANGTGQVIRYRIQLDAEGYPTEVELSRFHQPPLHFKRDTDGSWFDGSGNELEALRGATDVDISATPFTNTIPLRRLKLEMGQQAEILALWIRASDFEVRAVPQRYTRLGSHQFRYENLMSGYTNDIVVDDQLLVMDYPEAFQRISVQDI